MLLQERLSEFRQDLNREKARLEDERKQLQQDRERMRAEEERLERQALDVKQQTHNMNDTIMVSIYSALASNLTLIYGVVIRSYKVFVR